MSGLIDVVSGSFGAGHHAAARAIVAQFEAQGYATRTWDIVDLLPRRLGQAARAAYVGQVLVAPGSYRWMLQRSEAGRRTDWLLGSALRALHRPLLEVAAAQPLAIISTHPFASQALGALRARRQLRTPVLTYLTDMSVHRAWVHPGVDEHLALHEIPAEQARRAGAMATRVVRPAVDARFLALREDRRARLAARTALGLPCHGRLVLVAGGSEGFGELDRTAYEVAATGVGTPVVLCGRNRRVLRRLQGEAGIVALGWTSDIPRLLAAADVVVQNAGGMMSLEALAAGVPLVSYRCLAGHGETNAAALDAAGLVPWIRSPAGLRAGLEAALDRRGAGPSPVFRATRPDVVDVALAPRLRRSA